MPSIRIEQTMAGYAHGHGLQAASLPLLAYPSPPLKNALEMLTDLSGYLPRDYRTGQHVEVPASGYLTIFPCGPWYVVQRTWTDPLAGRPGCVTSHQLLVPIAAIQTLDLGALTALHRRPTDARDHEPYQAGFVADVAEVGPVALEGPERDEEAIAVTKLWTAHHPAAIIFETDDVSRMDDLLVRSWRYCHPESRALLAACAFTTLIRKTPMRLPFHLSMAHRSSRGEFQEARRVVELADLVPKPAA